MQALVVNALAAGPRAKSGGYPRDTENPAERMEDIRCAIDYLTTLPMLDEDRIGLLGVCAGGSYVLGVARHVIACMTMTLLWRRRSENLKNSLDVACSV